MLFHFYGLWTSAKGLREKRPDQQEKKSLEFGEMKNLISLGRRLHGGSVAD